MFVSCGSGETAYYVTSLDNFELDRRRYVIVSVHGKDSRELRVVLPSTHSRDFTFILVFLLCTRGATGYSG